MRRKFRSWNMRRNHCRFVFFLLYLCCAHDLKVWLTNLPVLILQKEIEALRHNLANISSTSDDGAQKLKEDYLHKLNVLEGQVITNALSLLMEIADLVLKFSFAGF